MSSDGYFEGDDFDEEALEELDAIEAAACKSPPRSLLHQNTETDSFYDITLDLDERDLQALDDLENDAYSGKQQHTARPSLSRTVSFTRQTTLFGEVLPPSSSSTSKRQPLQRSKSSSRTPFVQQEAKTKVWDHTAFAKTGQKTSKGKGKAKASHDNNDEEVEFEQFPAPFVSVGPPPPMKLKPDLLEAKHWIYPLNRPKRDYQFNIVKRCLFDNTIVALPTGLGKTFIAGVIMLNYYRWYPEGKVVFVAPTKPLVAQQIDACHQTCGIPGSDAAELTGEIPRATRGRLWKEKRVFYMTPQTLVNDLNSETCEVRDIVLLVVDEAHRATGDYAYNQIVRFLMAKNPHFRILALTATPGSTPDAVQNLIDGLHISHIEIRDENSLDLKPYIHNKKIEQHIIKMSEDVNKVKNLLATLIDKDLKPLRAREAIHCSSDPVKLHPYSAQVQMQKKEQRWAYAPLSRLASLARAMGYLIEGTLGMCDTYLQELSRSGDPDPSSAPGKTAVARKKGLREDPMFQAVLVELSRQKARGFSTHPKMDRLKTLIIEHFAQQLPDDDEAGSDQTRAMVFVTFREAVDEIVDALNFEHPLIRAHKFIGQGTDKQGKKGLAQKEQLEVIKKFKAGEFNVLVATSIGEEGLDIGEVDLIVCYDTQKTPIRMLQRLGRTGRKRAGVVHVLLAEGREDLNFDKAKQTYKEVQKTILRGEQLEFYTDVPRLLPDHTKPSCLEKAMEIQEYVRDEGKKSKKEARSSAAGTKRKRNDDISRNMPPGASTGFVSVASLLVKAPSKRKKVSPVAMKDFTIAGQDDDVDMDIEAGLVNVPPRRAQSLVPSSSKPFKSDKPRRTNTGVTVKSKRSKKEKPAHLSSSQFSNKGIDDVDDMDIERGLVVRPDSPETDDSDHPYRENHSKDKSAAFLVSSTHAVIDLTDSDNDPDTEIPINNANDSMAWLVDEDEDDNPMFEILDSSPVACRTSNSNADARFDGTTRSESTNTIEPGVGNLENDESIEFVDPSINIVPDQQPSSPLWPVSSSPAKPNAGRKRGAQMPPPILPVQRALGSLSDLQIPEPSFPVQPPAKARRLQFIDSPGVATSSPAPRRLHRRKSPKLQQVRSARVGVNLRANPAFDIEAEHSGDETSAGSSGPEDEETEEDRRFLQELPETQASPSYDQTLAYRQSLFTQAPMGIKAPDFSNAPIRRGAFGTGLSGLRRRPMVSSSPPRIDEEPDEYMLGSFVVDDDAEISYLSN